MEQATFLLQVAEVTISYCSKVKASDRPTVKSSNDAATILRTYWSGDMELLEEFVILFLNRANKVIGLFRVSRGGTTGTVVDPKIIFAAAIKGLAHNIILAHNHPSGNLSPSQPDIDLTRKLSGGGKLLDINVLDHIILTSEGYYSFSDEGILHSIPAN
jgi:DNA repair protein RadC